MADPARATVLVPLPELEDCGDCAALVHDYLVSRPGVLFVAIDRNANEARVEFDPRAFAESQVVDLLRAAIAGASPIPSLAASHARHREPDDHAEEEEDHTHAHGPGHMHEFRELARQNRTRLLVVAGLGAGVMVLQLVGGLVAGSLVLLSDAAHGVTDWASVALAAYAVHVAARPATKRKTFGWYRTEIVAAFLNAVGLWVISAIFVVAAIRRLRDPPEVDGGIVLVVGFVSLAMNGLLAWLLARGSKQNLNVRSAYLHLLNDAMGSAGALAAGAVIVLFGWYWADPLLTLLVTGLIVAWTWRLTRQTLHILLEGTPEDMDTDAIRRDVLAVHGVRSLHDLHVWSLTTGVHSMSAHIVVDDPANGPGLARDVRRLLSERHRLDHVTLEIEPLGHPCPACP